MENAYSYDRNSNITKLSNSSSLSSSLDIGGVSLQNFTYDGFNRLAKSNGNWEGKRESHSYTLNMKYNRTHGITVKKQGHEVLDLYTNALTSTANEFQGNYRYSDLSHPHAVSRIEKLGLETINFTYDKNGNQVQALHTGNWTRKHYWDEQDRLQAVVDGNDVQHYIYDASGTRVLKSSGNLQDLSINGGYANALFNASDYVMYPNGYLTVKGSEMTKHYYADSQRIASSIVDWDESANVAPRALMGGSDFSEQRQIMQKQLQDVLVDLGMEEDFVVMSATTCDDELQDILHNLELENMDRCLDWILDLIDKGDDSCTIIKYYDNSDCLLEDCKEEMEGWLGYFEQNNMDGCLTKLNYYILNSGLTDCAILEELKSTTDCYTIRTEVECYEEFLEQYWYCYNSTDVDCLLNFEKLLEEFKSYCELIEIIRQGPHYNPNPVPDPEEIYPEVEEPEVEPEAPEDEVVVIPNEPVIPEQPHISGKIWWYHSDHLGSSSYLTDINGIPTHYYGYLPFGELMVEHNNSNYDNVSLLSRLNSETVI